MLIALCILLVYVSSPQFIHDQIIVFLPRASRSKLRLVVVVVVVVVLSQPRVRKEKKNIS